MLTGNDEIFKLFFPLFLLYKDYTVLQALIDLYSEDPEVLKFDTMYKDFYNEKKKKYLKLTLAHFLHAYKTHNPYLGPN